MIRAGVYRGLQFSLRSVLHAIEANGSAVECCSNQTASQAFAPIPQLQAAPDRLSGGSFVIMALAPVVGSQLQERRFGYLMDGSGAFSVCQALDSVSSTLGRLQPGNATEFTPLSDGSRRGMAKKGKGKVASNQTAGRQAEQPHGRRAPATPEGTTLDFGEEKQLMDSSIRHLESQLRGMRSGRATPGLLDSIRVEAYGDLTPLASVAQVGVKDAQSLVATVYDPQVVSAVEKAIRTSPLGLNPHVQGQEIFIPVPRPSAGQQEVMQKLCKQEVEAAKVSVRSVRKQGMASVKQLASEDERFRAERELQNFTDKFIQTAEELGTLKAKEISTI